VTLNVLIDAELNVNVERAGELAMCVGVASPHATETLMAVGPTGDPMWINEVVGDGGRIQIMDSPEGDLRVSYRAEVPLLTAEPAQVHPLDAMVYRRPSRYCPSDQLSGLASAEFGGFEIHEAVFAIEQWLYIMLTYTPGVTDSTDDALHPLLTRTGVCRDYAHLGVAMCRALGLPARYVAVYAPGLDPMDFHAVYEVALDGRWWVFDGTRLAPRQSLVRIATGRDAADTALLTPIRARVGTVEHNLTVTTLSDLPFDERSELVALAG
jgi:transglutaminase-like putative cysteine protease